MSEKRTILVVDDEEAIRELFITLGKHDFFEFPVEVLVARNPEEAKKIFLANLKEISLVITDINLASSRYGQGWEIINFVSGFVGIKVAAMTGNDENLPALKERGIPYLEKPSSVQTIQKIINDLLRTDE